MIPEDKKKTLATAEINTWNWTWNFLYFMNSLYCIKKTLLHPKFCTDQLHYKDC